MNVSCESRSNWTPARELRRDQIGSSASGTRGIGLPGRADHPVAVPVPQPPQEIRHPLANRFDLPRGAIRSIRRFSLVRGAIRLRRRLSRVDRLQPYGALGLGPLSHGAESSPPTASSKTSSRCSRRCFQAAATKAGASSRRLRGARGRPR